MEVAGYIASALIGVSLGMIGGGGSILTVPVLVYLFQIEPTLATAYSLFIVGITASIGGIQSSLQKTVDFRTAIVFTIPSLIAVYLTRRFLLPLIPGELFDVAGIEVTKDMAIMVFFAILMFAAAISMMGEDNVKSEKVETKKYNYPMILVEGLIVGILTGFVGAGGGFLIIPALVLFAKLPMKKAVGTSLVIIAGKSLFGFMGDINSGQLIDFQFLALISTIAVVGIFIGNYFSGFFEDKKLKTAFGWLVIGMATYILITEIW